MGLDKLNSIAVTQMLPWSIILTNGDQKHRGVAGYVLRWVVIPARPANVPASASAYPMITPMVHFTPHDMAWTTMVSRKTNMPSIPKDQMAFITPVFTVDAMNGAPDGVADFVLDLYTTATSVSVSLDLVLFDNGEYYGPDVTGSSSYLQGLLSGRHDVAMEAWKLQQTGGRPMAQLQLLAAKTPLHTGITGIAGYEQGRIGAAQEIVLMTSQGLKEDFALTHMWRGLYKNRPRIHPGK